MTERYLMDRILEVGPRKNDGLSDSQRNIKYKVMHVRIRSDEGGMSSAIRAPSA
jgi:hypothetical protein